MNAPPRFRQGQLPSFLKLCVRHMQNRRPKPPQQGSRGPEGHGEKIWVFSHKRTDQVIYAFRDTLDGFHDLKQLPFNGKKTKPAKLRKDYWSPLASIEFGSGKGVVGLSVFQKLRELKHLHEVNWDDEFLYKRPEEFSLEDRKRIAEAEEKGHTHRPMRNKKDRGVALNAQKTNAIADMAVVLGGAGRGNRIVTSDAKEGSPELLDVTVKWANDQDRNYAEDWSGNVSHELFEHFEYSTVEAEKPTPEAATEVAGEAKTDVEGAQPEAEAGSKEPAEEGQQPKAVEKQPQKEAS